MQRRRSLRLVAGALVLSVPLLSSCGFGRPTDRVYTPAEGTNDRDGDVDILSAAIVAEQPNSGTFIATMSNNLAEAGDTVALESVELGTASAGTTEATDLVFDDIATAVDIAPRAYVNLADDDQGVVVRGDFEAGQFLPVVLTFSTGDTVEIDVPVVFACDEWEGLDDSAATAATSTDTAAEGLPEPGEPYDCEVVSEDHSEDTEPLVEDPEASADDAEAGQ
jgi:hypothetical protein